MYITVVIQIYLMYIAFSAGQSTVSEGNDSCDANQAIMDRIKAMENMMMHHLDELGTEVKNTKEEIFTRLDTIEREIRQMKQEANVTIKTTQEPSKDRVTMLRRQDGSVSFERNWADYKSGFGDIGGDGELWLGLDKLHQLTSENEYGLNVTMTAWDGKSFWAYYASFSVGPESDNYRLRVSGYDVSSIPADMLFYHNNMQFSTKDRDNDKSIGNCSGVYKGGWWYDACAYCNPTGQYLEGGVIDDTGITWWNGPHYSAAYSFKGMTLSLM